MPRSRIIGRAPINRVNPDKPIDLDEAFSAVSVGVRRATLAMHEALEAANVRHLLIGGVAVGAHGYPRATKDADFLVGEEAFNHHRGGIVTARADVPIAIGGILTDSVSTASAPASAKARLELLLDASLGTGSLPVIPIEDLLILKLNAFRPQDQADVLGLLRAGAVDVAAAEAHLESFYPGGVARFRRLVAATLK